MRALLDDLHLHWLQQRKGAVGCDDVGHQLVVPFGERGQANHRAPAAFDKICSAIGGGYPRAVVEIPNGPDPLITRQKPHSALTGSVVGYFHLVDGSLSLT